MATPWTVITDIPVHVITDNVLPFCETKDVISLGCTNKFFALTTDETFWKRKLAADYNFPVLGTARTSGWKFLYQRLRKPRIFVWGCVVFSFSHVTRVSICSSIHSRMLAGTIQRQRHRQTRVTTVSKDEPWECSFSG